MSGTVEDLIRAGGAALAFDTNALSGPRRLFMLCDLVNQLGKGPGALVLHLYAPVIAHEEMLLHIRQELRRKGSRYDAGVISDTLNDKGIEVKDFDLEHAEGVAELLEQRFPTPDSWRTAKRERCIQCLGLTKEQADAAPGQRCSATVDWLIAGQALKAGWILVTGDKGPEFQGLDRKITLDQLEALLRDMLAARGEHAPSGT